jgi:D-serine deaminase-like pyridoxal phosphate-dependent protein
VTPWKAAQLGDPLSAVDTPALVLDLDAFERNLARMADALRGAGVRLRPHAKSHKCPEIARRQIALGAVGICCQKVSEAAVFVEAGITDILLTNQVVGATKARQLAQIARRAHVGVLVDDPLQVQTLSQAAQAHAVVFDVYVEVDVGAGRCGVAPGAPVAALAREVASHSGLRFAGLQCYHGTAQHLRTPALRAAASTEAAAAAMQSREAVEACGITVGRVTGGGTGTFFYDSRSGVFDEVQPGSYIFMDRDYGDNLPEVAAPAFEHALFVRTTVMSRVTTTRAIVDAGLKASSIDAGLPTVWRRPALTFVKAADEHGVLEAPADAGLALGDALMLVPGHCDPTVNLYDELVCLRADRVAAIWPIAARGALL